MPQQTKQETEAAKRRRKIKETGVKVVEGTPQKATSPTATDRAAATGGGGGLTGMAKKAKASRGVQTERAPASRAQKNKAHVHEYFRWKNRQR